MTKKLNCLVFGTGEKLYSKKLGILHELAMYLTNAEIAISPTVVDNAKPLIYESARHFDRDPSLIPDIVRNRSNTYRVPGAKYHYGCHFSEHDLLIIYGVNHKFRNNVMSPKLIAKEMYAKAHSIADFYIRKIIELNRISPVEPIEILFTGFSRGACVALLAMNYLQTRLEREAPHLLELIRINAYLIDPVPGNKEVMKDINAHQIPEIVKNVEIVYAQDEERKGFLPLREFYRTSNVYLKFISVYFQASIQH